MILGARHGLSIIDVYCRSLKTSSVIINIISYQPYVVQLLFFLGHFPMWFSTMWHSQVARRCLQLAASTQSARATRRIECQLSGGTVVLFFLNAGETKIPPTGFGITLQFWDQFLRAFQIFGWICNQIVWMMFSNLLDGIPGKNRTESQRCGTKIEVHKKTHVDGCSTATISREFVFACTGSCFRQRSFVVLTVVRYTTWQ